MLVNLSASSRNSVSIAGYALVSEAQVTVGVALVTLGTPASNLFTITAQLCNRSTGGQNIRVGNAPAFAPAAGILLEPGQAIEINNAAFALKAIADGAGALLDVLLTTQQMG